MYCNSPEFSCLSTFVHFEIPEEELIEYVNTLKLVLESAIGQKTYIEPEVITMYLVLLLKIAIAPDIE